MNIPVTSPAFHNGEVIPMQYTADGQNISPPLEWPLPPGSTKSLALICEDPDAPSGTFTHWVIFNLPADCGGLSENTPTDAVLPSGARQGRNDFGKLGYSGPSPPPGKPHRYFFKLFALDSPLDVNAGARREDVLAAVRAHTVAEGHIMGAYSRPAKKA
jgi:Raf kinase inhibitor-like YbhB/YbcL family protein